MDKDKKALHDTAQKGLETLGVTEQMFSAVIKYLSDNDALFLCGGIGGCVKPCPQGQGCERFAFGNCICKKAPSY